ncbi:MAG TPA: hypothetical protein VHA09_04815 [Nitrososphaera sp.]|nr:hypothetical protein [Nitrososphaera sp.]
MLRPEKDIRLRIDLLEGQASSIAKMLAKAMQEHNEEAIKQYSDKLALQKSKVEELLWVLGVKTGQGVLDSRAIVPGRHEMVSVRDILDLLKEGTIRMDDLALDVQALVRKGALEVRNAMRYTT